MKKIVLIIAYLLASAGMMLAQDVYTAGIFLWNGRVSAGIWRNTDFLYEELSTLDYYYDAKDVLVHNGDVYWILNEYTLAWNWLIDDVSLEENWMPGVPESTPYFESFDGGEELGYYWYILDNDHSGDQRCWKKDFDEECAYHPWGNDDGIYQDGWLFSPLIYLEDGKNYELSFYSMIISWSSESESSVWITNLENEYELPNPDNYIFLGDIMDTEGSWLKSYYDISKYAGNTIRIAFNYGGVFAHTWFLDNILIDESTAPTYNVTASVHPLNAGTVTGVGPYLEGTTCTLIAKPNTGYQFARWKLNNEEVSTNQIYSFEVTEDVAIEAEFKIADVKYYTITTDVIPEGTGSVEGGGNYPAGTTVTITAKPNQGFVFDKWNDNVNENPREIVVSENIQLIAYFKSSGIDESQNSSLTLFPNPAENSFRIKGIEEECHVRIYNSLGMLVKTLIVNNEQEININDLASGLYLVRCGSQSLRFVKR